MGEARHADCDVPEGSQNVQNYPAIVTVSNTLPSSSLEPVSSYN